jgi:hypothetical protein
MGSGHQLPMNKKKSRKGKKDLKLLSFGEEALELEGEEESFGHSKLRY